MTYSFKQLQKDKSNKPLIDWLSCKEDLLKLGFSLKEIEPALRLSKTTLRDLTDSHYVPYYTEQKYYENNKYYELINEDTSGFFTEYKDIGDKCFERHYSARAKEYRMIANYQGLKHAKILRKLFKLKFKWFDKFEWDIYELGGYEHAEIYLKTEFGTLYVPLKALMNKNPGLIRNRMLEYWGWYRKNRNYKTTKHNHKENEHPQFCGLCQQKFYEDETKPLESKEFKQLSKYLQKGDK